MSLPIQQRWNLKKAVSYILYKLLVKSFPDTDEIAFIGEYSTQLRSALCKNMFAKFGVGTRIGKGVNFDNGSNISIGKSSVIGSHTLLSGTRASLIIDDDVFIGKRCIILVQNHKYIGDKYNGYEGKDVYIRQGAKINSGSILLAGVTIGKNATVMPGSVVARDIPEDAVVIGNPAKQVESLK